MKKAILALLLASVCSAQTTHTFSPISTGTLAARPATCVARLEFYNQTDQTSGLYVCNAAGDGWNRVGGSPASPATSVQFNDGGSFGGESAFAWDKTLKGLAISTTGAGVSGWNTDTGAIAITRTVTGTGNTYAGVVLTSDVTEDVTENGSEADGVVAHVSVAGHVGSPSTDVNGIGLFGTAITAGAVDFNAGVVGVSASARHSGTGTINRIIGGTFGASNFSGNVADDARGVFSGLNSSVGSTVTTGRAFYATRQTSGGGTFGTLYGLDIGDFSGGTTISAGIHIADQGVSANDWAVKIDGGKVQLGPDLVWDGVSQLNVGGVAANGEIFVSDVGGANYSDISAGVITTTSTIPNTDSLNVTNAAASGTARAGVLVATGNGARALTLEAHGGAGASVGLEIYGGTGGGAGTATGIDVQPLGVGSSVIGVDIESQGAANTALRTGTGKVLLRDTVQILPSAFAFADLPACGAGTEGSLRPVNNSNTATWGANVAAGGANHILAYCDGTNWTVAAK